MRIALVTCSFRGDLDLCRLLCRSVDRYATEFPHRLYVPRSDLPLFAEFASERRRVEAQESLLPSSFWRAPLPSPQWRKRLLLPRCDLFLTPFHGPVRGWLAQKIMKIAASLDASCDMVVHLDSDAALIQPLSVSHLAHNGRARFYAGPVVSRLPRHVLWHHAAAGLLGMPLDDYYRWNYVAPMIVWRRAVVEAMTARIKATTGRSWQSALAAIPHFSEYVLYGLFVDHIMGLETASLRREQRSRCLTRWTENFAASAGVENFLAGAAADHLVCGMQSTLNVPLDLREEVLDRAAETVARLRAQRAA